MANRFLPLQPDTSQSQLLAIVNRNFAELDNESVTKVFYGQNSKPNIITGRLPYGGFGSLYYDETGTPRILIGTAPDGTMGWFVSKPNVSVLDLFT